MTVAVSAKLAASVACLLFLLTSAEPARALDFDLATATGAKVQFTGNSGTNNDTFTFVDNSEGNDFVITDGELTGMTGNIDGIFYIGPIQSTFYDQIQYADVTGEGTFSLYDGSGDPASSANTLTATLEWTMIYTVGTTGGINAAADVNLSNFVYTGTDPVLLALVSGGDPTVTASFQFNPPKTLGDLTATGASNSTSYSGSVSAVPEPGTLILLGTGLASAAGIGLRRRRNK